MYYVFILHKPRRDAIYIMTYLSSSKKFVFQFFNINFNIKIYGSHIFYNAISCINTESYLCHGMTQAVVSYSYNVIIIISHNHDSY